MIMNTKRTLYLQLLSLFFGALCGQLAFSQITANPFAPKNQQATVAVAPNGVPIVNIQAPSAGGVSRNQYNQFNVPTQGAILNNSRKGAMTHQGGAIAGNPWLGGGEARIILNEVKGPASQLDGYLEVGGTRAEVIVANPAGITCNGCGFINADKGTLTTGRVNIVNGVIQGIDVSGGKITIGERGFNGSDTNYAALIAKTIEINGPITAKELSVISGENTVLPTGEVYSKGAQGEGYGIDVKQLGGMYAGKITLMATDKGVGIRNHGAIGANFNEITITADGQLVNTGVIAGNSAVHLKAAALHNEGSISAKQNLAINTPKKITNTKTGQIIAESAATPFQLTADNIVNQGLMGSNAAFIVTATQALTNEGSLLSYTRSPLSITAHQLSNSGTIAGQGTITLGIGTLTNSGSIFSQAEALFVRTSTLTNHGLLGAYQSLDIKATGALSNAGSLISEAGNLNLSSNTLTNAGTIGAQGLVELDINNALINQGNIFSQGALSNLGAGVHLTAKNLTNTGTIGAKSGLKLTIAETLLNQDQGALLSEAGNINLSAHELMNAGTIGAQGLVELDINNALINQGNIFSQGALSNLGAGVHLTAKSLTNTGTIGAKSGLKLTIAETLLNQDQGALLSEAGNINLSAHELMNTGTIGAQGLVEIGINNALINQGTIFSQGAEGALSLTAKNLSNTGMIGAKGNLTLDIAGAIINEGSPSNGASLISETGSLKLSSNTLTNTGTMGALGALNLGVIGTLINQGDIFSQGDTGVNIRAGELDNEGLIGSKTGLSIDTAVLINKKTIVSEGSDSTGPLNIIAQTLTNAVTGTIGGKGVLQLVGTLINNQGSIIGEGALLTLQSDTLNNSGLLGAKGALNIAVTQSLDNSGTIIAEGKSGLANTDALTIGAQTLTNSGHIESAGGLGITSQTLDNSGALYTSQKLTMGANQIINSGTMGALEAGTINAGTLEQRANSTLASGGDLTLNLINSFTNEGTLSSQGTLTLTTDTLTNKALLEAGVLNVNAQNLHNQSAGTINANSAHWTINGLINQQGVMSIGELVATAQNWNNEGSTTIGDATFNLSGTFTNTAKGLLLTDTLNLNAKLLENYGLIDGETVALQIADTLTNYSKGMIFGTDLTISAHTLNNLGVNVVGGVAGNDGAIIAGRDYLGMGVNTLNNTHHSLILSMGDMDIGGRIDSDGYVVDQANYVHNLGGRIESFGDMSIAANTIKNESRYFEIGSERSTLPQDIYYSYATLSDLDDTIQYRVGDSGFHWVYWGGQNPNNTANDFAHLATDQKGAPQNQNDMDSTHFIQFVAKGTAVKEFVVANDAGQIISGGNLYLEGDKIINDKSTILAGADAYIEGLLDNRDYIGKETLTTTTNSTLWTNNLKNEQYIIPSFTPDIKVENRTTALNAVNFGEHSTIIGSDLSGQLSGIEGMRNRFGGLIEFNWSLTELNSGVGGFNGSLGVGGSLGNVGGSLGGGLDSSLGRGFSSYYQVNSQFARGRTFTSSDYLLSSLGYRVDMLKRLGDGFYEQRLIQEQIFQLTGSRYLEEFTNDEEQYKALMNNALGARVALNLVPGIALTEHQIESLTNSIVWMVEREVTLDDGSQVKALVPVIYSKPGTVSVNTSGALVSANRLIIDTDKAFINEGTLLGKTDLVVSGFDVINKGLIAGGDIRLFADNDIGLIGGMILAENSAHLVAGRDINLASTIAANNQGSHLDQVASIIVTGRPASAADEVMGFYDGSLIVEAGRDLNMNAAMVSNYADGGITQLSAERDITLGTLVTTNQTTNIYWGKKAKAARFESSYDSISSDLYAQGDMNLSAGRDLTSFGASIVSNDGDLRLSADRNITLGAAQSGVYVFGTQENQLRTKGSGWIKEMHARIIAVGDPVTIALSQQNKTSGSKVTAVGDNYHVQSEGTLLSGNNIVMNAGNDLTLRGATVVAYGDIIGVAKNNITIEGTRESHGGSFDKTTIRHGLMGASGSGIGFSVGERFIQKTTIDTIGNNIGSLVASAGGDVIFSAGNNYRQEGSDVHAYTGDIFIKGADVQIVSSQDESYHYERNYRRQTGVTFQIGHPAIAAYNTINRLNDSLKDVKEHNSRLNTVAAGAAALSLRNNYDSYKRDMGVTNVEGIAQNFANQPFKSGASGFNISVSGGTQRQQSTSTSTESSHIGSSVSAGRNVYIESTDRDILVEGSLIKAGNNVTLNAARDLVVLAGTDKSQTTADRSSSGFSIGGSVAVGSGGLKFGITVSGNAGRGSGNYDHTNYQNSYITAGNQLGIVTGRDAVIMGGVLSGDKIYADIGRDLVVRSMQDVERDKSTDYSGGASVSWGGGWSASANVDYQNIKGDYLSVQEQSGLFAGDQGFDITVKGHTELIGAAITSSQKAVEEGLNQLTTGTLNLTDLENHAKYEGEGISLGGGYGNGKWGVNPPINLSAGEDTKSTTKSGISGGLITITDLESQQALLDEKANQLAIDKAAEGIDKEGIDKEGMGTDHLVIEGLSKLQLHNKPILGKDEEIDEAPKPPTVEEYLASINRDVLTGVDQSNALERVYDESSIKASMEIAKIFRDETNTFAANRARETDEAKATIKAYDQLKDKPYNEWSDEEKKLYNNPEALKSANDQAVQTVADNKIWEPGGNGRLIMTAISLAVGGNATGSMSDLIRDAGVNVLQSLITSEIKNLADSLQNEGLRAILHTIIGCAGAAAKEGDCASGALAAGASSVIGSILNNGMSAEALSKLTEEEKNNRVNLITSLITAITAAAGGDVAMAEAAAKIEMENNQINGLEGYLNASGNQAAKNRAVSMVEASRACQAGDQAACQQFARYLLEDKGPHLTDAGKVIVVVGGIAVAVYVGVAAVEACLLNPYTCTTIVVQTAEGLFLDGAIIYTGAVTITKGVVQNADEILAVAGKYGDDVLSYTKHILSNGTDAQKIALGPGLASGDISILLNKTSSFVKYNGISPENIKYVDILSPSARRHILYGDSLTSGGHLFPGNPGKTTFPQSWSADKVVHEIGDIATAPATQWYAQTGTGGMYTNAGRPARWAAYEVRDGVRIRVIYEPANGTIITAFPDNAPIPPSYKPIR